MLAKPAKIEVMQWGSNTPYLTIRQYDYIYGTALTDDNQSDIVKMQDDPAVATVDLLFAEMASGRVHGEYYYNPANYNSPAASELLYESLGFEITKGYSLSSGTDKKDTDGVTSGLAWYGLWDEI